MLQPRLAKELRILGLWLKGSDTTVHETNSED